MIKSIIENIYSNNECLREQIALSEEYKKASDKAYKSYKQLREILNDEQKNILEEFEDLEIGVCAESSYMNFKEGLKVGLLLAMECLI